jgi:hypothetical protein
VNELICPFCGKSYKQIALHWRGKKCNRPSFTDEQIEIMSGLLLGDGDIKPGTDGSIFRLRMTNKPFVEWVSSKLSPLSRGVFLSQNSTKQKESALRAELEGVTEDSDFKDLYGIRTVTHPQINQLRDWYSSGKKRYPDSITEEMLRMWYVTDGNKHPYGMRITCDAQKDVKEDVIDMIKEIDYIENPSFNKDGTITITADESREFMRNTEAPSGFEYKWF